MFKNNSQKVPFEIGNVLLHNCERSSKLSEKNNIWQNIRAICELYIKDSKRSVDLLAVEFATDACWY